MSVKNHPTSETKKPKVHGECWNSFGFFVFLVFWFFGFLFFFFFDFLVFWFFVFLVFWSFGCLVLLWRGIYLNKFSKTKKIKNQKPKNQRTKKPKNQKTKKPKKQRTKEPKNQKNKKTKNQNCSSILRGALVFWFRSSGGSSRTRSEGSNSIPRKKHEHAGGSDVLKGAVCHGGGGDHLFISSIVIDLSFYRASSSVLLLNRTKHYYNKYSLLYHLY